MAHLPERAQVRRWGSRRSPPRAMRAQQGGGGQGSESHVAAAAAWLGAQKAEALTRGHHAAQKTRPRKPGAKRGLRLPRKQGPSVTGGWGGCRAASCRQFSPSRVPCAGQHAPTLTLTIGLPNWASDGRNPTVTHSPSYQGAGERDLTFLDSALPEVARGREVGSHGLETP